MTDEDAKDEAVWMLHMQPRFLEELFKLFASENGLEVVSGSAAEPFYAYTVGHNAVCLYGYVRSKRLGSMLLLELQQIRDLIEAWSRTTFGCKPYFWDYDPQVKFALNIWIGDDRG